MSNRALSAFDFEQRDNYDQAILDTVPLEALWESHDVV
jgi:hypothetical protein